MRTIATMPPAPSSSDLTSWLEISPSTLEVFAMAILHPNLEEFIRQLMWLVLSLPDVWPDSKALATVSLSRSASIDTCS